MFGIARVNTAPSPLQRPGMHSQNALVCYVLSVWMYANGHLAPILFDHVGACVQN